MSHTILLLGCITTKKISLNFYIEDFVFINKYLLTLIISLLCCNASISDIVLCNTEIKKTNTILKAMRSGKSEMNSEVNIDDSNRRLLNTLTYKVLGPWITQLEIHFSNLKVTTSLSCWIQPVLE